jgi:hypothetical protein
VSSLCSVMATRPATSSATTRRIFNSKGYLRSDLLAATLRSNHEVPRSTSSFHGWRTKKIRVHPPTHVCLDEIRCYLASSVGNSGGAGVEQAAKHRLYKSPSPRRIMRVRSRLISWIMFTIGAARCRVHLYQRFHIQEFHLGVRWPKKSSSA